ncbi:unnamed protein product [Larinioides sclopetarius]|uniref:Uncharacterized protein n=1 Tax=Larinioides sclopetarius TaxID=280406 RepID=A0AAV2A4I8_9ARAC
MFNRAELHKMLNLTRASKWFVIFSLTISIAQAIPIDVQDAGAAAISGANGIPEDLQQPLDNLPTLDLPDIPDNIGSLPDLPDIPVGDFVGKIATGFKDGLLQSVEILKSEPFPDNIIHMVQTSTIALKALITNLNVAGGAL